MINIKNSRYIVAILLLVLSINSAAKEERVITLEDGKVHYILEVMRHILWPNDSKIDEFNLVIVSKNIQLLTAFNHRDNNQVRGKNTIIKQAEYLDTISQNANVIVVDASQSFEIVAINERFKNALIISDGQVSKAHLMVAILTSRNQIKLTINRDNIINRGFKITNSLLDFAGTKADLVKQLTAKDHDFNQLLEKVKSKEALLTHLNQSLDTNKQHLQQVLLNLNKQNNQLLVAHRQLAAVKEQLTALQASKEAIKLELATHKSNLTAQQQLMAEKEVEHHQQQQKLTVLNQAIAANKIALGQQVAQLEQQNSTIQHKEEKISQQQTLLYASTGIALVILLLIFLVLRINIKRKQTNIKLYQLATTDDMTKLFNRRHFLSLAQRELNKLHRTHSDGAVLMIDIDHFKKINDRFGHAAGDQAIINVAKILQDNLRSYDIVGRVGGEEFAMLFTNCEINTATQIAERIRQKAADLTTKFQQEQIKLTVSIGITARLQEEKSIESMLHRADEALYQAKQSGRNKVVLL
ncbi:hypothetical protein NBRC116592_10620 [Colwellia sp. KU-HH00111]|uniref:YfiR/HmsC family protein n=1 Tax=Colwellia sp. KU-HH00111 TaxID=3127652 RepID=UPI003109F6BD